jgi:hypothetical protein
MPALIVPLLAPDLILRILIKDLFFCPHNAGSGRSDGEEVVRESYLSGVILARFLTVQPLLARSQLTLYAISVYLSLYANGVPGKRWISSRPRPSLGTSQAI